MAEVTAVKIPPYNFLTQPGSPQRVPEAAFSVVRQLRLLYLKQHNHVLSESKDIVIEMPTPPSEHHESAQDVASYFVYFYYTHMNMNPQLLYKFYGDESSFVYSGLDQPGQKVQSIIGQKDIHECIMQMNIKDCHTKIRQVKGQKIRSDRLVVQVTGEFSNKGGLCAPFF
ncbi:uncharacterized protein TNIN_44531 [Trichonephila inaurata madagascariensis]|uniref:NTF2 domain-containing protein n=1 Tax=Trichonephila inaurata madagascariensis TaxID=2747483 RepID=A0A8X7BP09_9ARAC|nr:uncharacterized protein TNIN_44531 [Trichonephila inaurata madagascariensis]